MKKIFISLLVVTSLSAATLSVHAQTPATDSAATIRDSVKQKVNEELAQIKKGIAKKGFIGQVTAVSDATISLTNVFGQTRKVLIAADTTVKLLGGSDGTPADVKANLYILAMGDVDSQNTMTAKRLLVVAKPDTDTRSVVYGAVAKSSTSSLTIGQTAYKITSTTKYTGKTKSTDIVVGANVMAVIDGSSATRIQLVSTATPISSPSATPKQ